MKNIIIALIFLFPALTYGQVSHSDSASGTTITTYLGALSGPKVSTENGRTSGFVTLRGGGSVAWAPNKHIMLFGHGAGETDQSGTVAPFANVGARFILLKPLSFTIGKI